MFKTGDTIKINKEVLDKVNKDTGINFNGVGTIKFKTELSGETLYYVGLPAVKHKTLGKVGFECVVKEKDLLRNS